MHRQCSRRLRVQCRAPTNWAPRSSLRSVSKRRSERAGCSKKHHVPRAVPVRSHSAAMAAASKISPATRPRQCIRCVSMQMAATRAGAVRTSRRSAPSQTAIQRDGPTNKPSSSWSRHRPRSCRKRRSRSTVTGIR
ncbi:conserved hypothetical protein [Ricinus communis]|uniref:Uncharacterized protein n=1 Tax=Ricinus communis TaxID=3988 RepID=B9T989_RICCO|nr:conserved hypothetical protein [Ricinus communis]